jgi:hypothetical protein
MSRPVPARPVLHSPVFLSAFSSRPSRLGLHPLLLMGLALLTFSLLSARSAHAQQSPGHYWQVTYAYSHIVDNHFIRDVPTPGQISPSSCEGSSNIVDGDVEQTVTATLTWVPAAGMDNTSDPPTRTVYLEEHAMPGRSPCGVAPVQPPRERVRLTMGWATRRCLTAPGSSRREYI